MHPVSGTNIYHDVTDLVNHGMVKNTKPWICQQCQWLYPVVFCENG